MDELIRLNSDETVNSLLAEKAQQAQDIKSAIDILATQTALKQAETVEKVVTEKQEELRNDAEAKRIEAETAKILKQVEKVKQEQEKQLAELDKVISAKQKEVEQLKADSDKAQAFFDSNKDIMRYIGIRERKSLHTMQVLMVPATVIFVIVQALLFPLTLIGILLETIVNILGGVCGAVTNNALKIIISIIIIAVLLGGGFCAYFFGGKLLTSI